MKERSPNGRLATGLVSLPCLVAVLGATAACSSDPGAATRPCSDHTFSVDPSITLSAATVSPGEQFSASYPSAEFRTDYYRLDSDGDNVCDRAYDLTGDEDHRSAPDWKAEPAGGVFGVGADVYNSKEFVEVAPDVLKPGTYRVCDGTITDSCAQLTIAGSAAPTMR